MRSIIAKIQKYTLPFFLFLLPWQTRWIFGQELIAGEPFQFGVLSLYATEVLLLLVAIVYFITSPDFFIKFKNRLGVIIVLIILIISILISNNPQLTAVQSLHIAFAILFYFLFVDERTDLQLCLKAFVAGLVIPVILGIFQVVTGGSPASTVLGLASRQAQTLGDAVLTLGDGTRILRAYGSFPHPNIFGGYLVTGIFTLLIILSNKATKNLYWLAFVFLFIGLIATYSQSAWLALISVVAVFFLTPYIFSNASLIFKGGLKWIIGVAIIVFSISGVFALEHFGFVNASVVERVAQYREWPQVMEGHWLFGWGIGQYPYAIESIDSTRSWWQYQPVHNVLLLVFGEIGLVGFFGLIFVVIQAVWKNINRDMLALLFVLLILGSFDHYLWSNWSGLALCALVLAIVRIKHKPAF